VLKPVEVNASIGVIGLLKKFMLWLLVVVTGTVAMPPRPVGASCKPAYKPICIACCCRLFKYDGWKLKPK
jgi:hypothetical protein